MMIAALSISVAYLFISFINLITTIKCGFDKVPDEIQHSEPPSIAILVAARNEENNIRKCLESLVKLNYPENRLSILVGNDQSTDNTAFIVSQFEEQYPNLKQIHIKERIGKAKGKANVLAQLAHQTNATYLLITDADIEVKPDWAVTLLSFFDDKTGIVSGTTIVKREGFLGAMQQTDWLYFMGLLQTFERFGIHSTAVGNNMAIKRDAYLSTGGYEHFDFSITEDYKLYEQTRKQGWETINMVNRNAVNFSAAAPDFKTLLNQRKRWIKGGMELPFHWWLILGIFGLFTPAIIYLCFVDLKSAIILYSIKIIIQSITILFQLRLHKLTVSLIDLVVYEVYSIAITLLTAFYSVIPSKVNWKNRYY